MSFDALIQRSLSVVAIGIVAPCFVVFVAFTAWALVGQRGEPRMRRLRVSLSAFLLFAAGVLSVISTHYFSLTPDIMRIVRPEFQPPYQRESSILLIMAPAFVLLSAGLVICALWRQRGTRKRILQVSLCCFLVTLAVGAVNYGLIFSIQAPAFERYTMIESRDWLTHVGEAAPDFSVTMLDNSQVHSSDLRGKIVLLNFFATWCGPCMVELLHLEELWSERRGNDDFTILVVGREEPQETVAKFQSENGYTFPMAVDPDRSAFGKFANDGIPRTYLISRDGRILYQSMGFAEIDLYARELARLRQIIDSELATPQ